MDILQEELENHINNCMDNIHINNDTDKPDEEMASPGSVRGQLHNEPEILTPEENAILERRNYILKVKIVALDIIDKPLFMNPRDMRAKDREILIKTCEEVMANLTPEQITTKFNHIVCRDVLTLEMDISSLPIYSNKSTHSI